MKLFLSPGGFFIVCFTLLPISSNAKTTDRESAQLAEAAYALGHYEEASNQWKEVLMSGVSDPDLFYNIAVCESMSGHLPDALMNFEKARRFKPSDPHIGIAIERERNRIENAVIPVDQFFLISWWTNIISVFRPGIWAIMGLLSLIASLIIWLAAHHAIKTGKLFIPGKFWIYGLTGFVLILIAILSYREIYKLNEGIIYADCELNQGPSIQSPEIRLIYPGEKVRIVDEISGWYKINLLNLDEGWVKKECLKIIDLRDDRE